MMCTKFSSVLLLAAVSLFFVLSFSGSSQTEAKALRVQQCVGNLHKVCQFIGSYCHAEVLSGRKRRSVMSSAETAYPSYMSRLKTNKPKRRRVKIKVKLTGKCKLCAHYCW